MIEHINNKQARYYDAIIVGASISGCVCALELASKGWRVAVIEKRQASDFYKKICTHIIHPYGVNQLKKFGIFDSLLNKSALMTAMNIHHETLTVVYPFARKPEAANIERRDLDPALRKAVLEKQNINLMTGYRINALIHSEGTVTGVSAINSLSEHIDLHAPIVIGADGRNSTVVKLAKGDIKVKDNKRVALFSYFSYDAAEFESQVWALRQGEEYIGFFPNRDHAVITWYLPRAEYEQKIESNEQSFKRLIGFLAQHGIEIGERQESIIIVKDSSPQASRIKPGAVALIGDAKLAADPLTGIGCTWAMQSARLLSACLGKAPAEKPPLFSGKRNTQLRITLYSLLHILFFKVPSNLMTFISMHGKWVFNRPVYRFLAWFTGAKKHEITPPAAMQESTD